MNRQHESTLNIRIEHRGVEIRIWRTLDITRDRHEDDNKIVQTVGSRLQYELPHLSDFLEIAQELIKIDGIAAIEVRELSEFPHTSWPPGEPFVAGLAVKRGVVIYEDWP